VFSDREIATDQLLTPPLPGRIIGEWLGISALQRNQMRVLVVLGDHVFRDRNTLVEDRHQQLTVITHHRTLTGAAHVAE
jgi:hypothetical protein